MKLPLLSLAATALALAALMPNVQAAGFDCSKASTQVEKTVCDTPSLSAQDEELNRRYKALKHLQVFRLLQVRWLQERNTCNSTDCLEGAYRAQLKMLAPQPLPIPPAPSKEQLRPMAPTSQYSLLDPDGWQRYPLATFNAAPPQGDQQIVDTQVIAGVLHVVLFVGQYQQGQTGYIGTLYEYADDQPGLHPIAQDIGFVGWSSPGSNDQGMRFAGIADGLFYYRQRSGGDLQQSMTYHLGSRRAPEASQQLFQSPTNTLRHARARVAHDLNQENYSLSLDYDQQSNGTYSENVTEHNEVDSGWSIVNPTWSETRPVMYFDNEGPRACIWRVDVQRKLLSKIVPEHEAVSARPVDIHGREAVVYLERNQLKFALNPDD
ncbi:hypothetical protein GV819_05375 [Pseudomonas sp. Fl5BN2]|uniref:lysozyme inhibitor LprI family protein n=2 Tax=unclassified Pseudomonas TaxID=196821 RepID=UPI001376F098|nr:hypothetical protein [Pseudomonas sp. Fl4BN1]NBF01717.1 hypothetical protein [Pseudomonas sp. Fl5BN2]NBF07228.1 hypothetical protein [Pseudomonas sp. Fl4BN1]